MRWTVVILLVFLVVSGTGDAVSQNVQMNRVKRERQAALRNVSETAGKLNSNKRQTARSLRELNTISSDIYEHKRSIDRIQHDVAECDGKIKSLGDSISQSSARLERLRRNYANAVRKMRVHSTSFDQLAFLFTSSSVHEAYRRIRYLRQFAKWRDRQSAEIRDEMLRLERQKGDVVRLKDGQVKRAVELGVIKSSLEKKQIRQNEVIADLRREGGALQKLLDEQNRKAEALDRELDRLIALEEQRVAERRRRDEEARKRKQLELQAETKKRNNREKNAKQAQAEKRDKRNNRPGKVALDNEKPEPITITQVNVSEREERTLSGSFECNKGRLPYPVAGNCRVIRRFGRQPHPELKHVMTNNGGIDIEAPKGAVARTVFSGKVSAVFRQDGYNMVVMVRHGKYLTIYVNLSEIYVRVGQEVKMNQPIGKISTDLDNGGRAVLHFEVRREKQKMNPMEWLK